VDPRRALSAASIDVHGITPDLLAGQPVIGDVLPRFARFAEEPCSSPQRGVRHAFLAMKETATGVHFTQPVLDTLLLSAVASPNQETHSLEAIAERLGVPIVGRHTASAMRSSPAKCFCASCRCSRNRGFARSGKRGRVPEDLLRSRLLLAATGEA